MLAGSNFYISSITAVIVNPVSIISSIIMIFRPLISFFNPLKAFTIPVDYLPTLYELWNTIITR